MQPSSRCSAFSPRCAELFDNKQSSCGDGALPRPSRARLLAGVASRYHQPLQHRTHYAQQDGANKSRHKVSHMESSHQRCRQFQHERVDHEPEQAERKVRILRIKPIVALIKPMAAAAISAATGPLTLMPGTMWATIHTARALRTQCSRSRTIGLRHPMIGHYTRENGSKDKCRAAPRPDGDPLRAA